MTTLPRWTRPARWWGTRGRTARRVALAPTSSATRASSSTSRASASTEPKLQESSAELVTPAQNSQITFQFMWFFSRGIPRCDPGQCPVWDEPEAGSSLPCRQVRASDEGAPPQNVSRCLLLSYSCFVVLPKLYSCLVFLSQLKTSEPGLQVRIRPGDKGLGRQPAGRLVQRIIIRIIYNVV